MAQKTINRPERVEEYAAAALDVKLYKAFINYLRFRGVVGKDEFTNVPVSETVEMWHGAAYAKFSDIDALVGLYSYNWHNLGKECAEFMEFLATLDTSINKLGYKNICAKFDLDYELVKLGIKRYRFYSKELGRFTVGYLRSLTLKYYRELDETMYRFKKEIEEHEALVQEIRQAIEANPELENQGEAAIHNIEQMIDWKMEAYDYLYANS